jgi:hypothetical protein
MENNKVSQIRMLDEADAEAYGRFRRKVWPLHPVCGAWDSVRFKYFSHSQSHLCPESGLYAYISGDQILGVMGALPFPLTIAGQINPGHIIVDAVVSLEFQHLSIAGFLFYKVKNLPGVKVASYGSPDSQSLLKKRAQLIPSQEVKLVFRRKSHWILNRIGSLGDAYPAPIHWDEFPFDDEIMPYRFNLDDILERKGRNSLIFVDRDNEFWKAHCDHRMETGCLVIKIAIDESFGAVALRVEQVANYRVAHLLDVVIPHDRTVEMALKFRQFLDSLNVISLRIDVGDPDIRQLAEAIGGKAVYYDSHWWHIPKLTDPEEMRSCHWRLKLADRDFHYQHLGRYHWRP